MINKKNITLFFLLFLAANFSIYAETIPTNPSKVTVSGRQLIVEKRLPDETLDTPVAYKIKGITWTPASSSPEKGENPLTPNIFIEYGFFYDWSGRVPQGHDILTYWKKKEHYIKTTYPPSSEPIYPYKIDLPIIRSMNVNTIRVYNDFGDDSNKYNAILDECYRNGIMVIMAVANSKEELDNKTYLSIVKAYKNHPAILMWCLGNEWNLDYNRFYTYPTVKEAALKVNEVAAEIKAIDREHPVSSCLGDRFFDAEPTNKIDWIVQTCINIDLWGINVYRGQSFGSLFTQWKAITTKPFYLTEFGIDSFNTTYFEKPTGKPEIAYNCKGEEDEETQAMYFIMLWNEIVRNLSADDSSQVCLGGCVHEFNDQLWKVGCYHAGLGGIKDPDNNGVDYKKYNKEGFVCDAFPDKVINEEYFGVIDETRQKKKAIYYEIENCYRQ